MVLSSSCNSSWKCWVQSDYVVCVRRWRGCDWRLTWSVESWLVCCTSTSAMSRPRRTTTPGFCSSVFCFWCSRLWCRPFSRVSAIASHCLFLTATSWNCMSAATLDQWSDTKNVANFYMVTSPQALCLYKHRNCINIVMVYALVFCSLFSVLCLFRSCQHLSTSSASCLVDVTHLSLTNLETLQYFKHSQLKL